jgi:hypothetical protein
VAIHVAIHVRNDQHLEASSCFLWPPVNRMAGRHIIRDIAMNE